MAFAVTSLENLALKQQEAQAGQNLTYEKSKKQVNSKEDAYKQLSMAVQGRLSFVLQNPQTINSKNIQDILNMLKLMEQVAPKEEEAKTKQSGGMSKELAENIRKALNLAE